MGTLSKGAGIYDIKDHRWFDFEQIREREIKRILFKGDLLWFLTDNGIYVYEIQDQQSDTNGFFCRLMPKRTLEATDLIDIKVYSFTHAMAITEDRGCYLFIDKWTDKLLGGDNVPGLTQDAIAFALYWQNRIVVMGESFGIAAYDPLNRNWTSDSARPLSHPLMGMIITKPILCSPPQKVFMWFAKLKLMPYTSICTLCQKRPLVRSASLKVVSSTWLPIAAMLETMQAGWLSTIAKRFW